MCESADRTWITSLPQFHVTIHTDSTWCDKSWRGQALTHSKQKIPDLWLKIKGLHKLCSVLEGIKEPFILSFRDRNSGLSMAKMQAKIQVWQAKINLNCQTENKMAGESYWTGVVPFSSPLTMLLYPGVSTTFVISGHWRCNRQLWPVKGLQGPFP